MAVAAEQDLLFGLLALQNGLVDQGRLVAAFAAWTNDRGRSLADHLVARGDLDGPDRATIEALVAPLIHQHGESTQRSVAAVPAGRSTRASQTGVADPAIESTLAHVSSRPDPDATIDRDDDLTVSDATGTATPAGQRFRILRPHARGGLGAVYVALDSELNREVALKTILPDHADDPVSRARFLIEAEITGGLEHPGIVPVYSLGTTGDARPFYAMRFIKGDTLKHAIERFHADQPSASQPGRRALGLRDLLRRLTDVCNAVDYAHGRGVLHRDIKPGNIIVGKHGETLVVDWGLAKALGQVEPGRAADEHTLVPSPASGSAETLPGSALGTPAYMSPEQAEGRLDRLGPWSDVYSLGTTLYCVLTGEPPFGGDVADVIRDVRAGRFRAPRELDADIDRALEAICLKAMALAPEDRYSTPRALADDLERWAADEPVSAWREPAATRASRWARRHRTTVAAASVGVITVLIALAAVAGVTSRVNAALKLALEQSEESRRQAEAVSTFLVDSFRSAGPEEDGKDVKVVDVIDRAAGKLGDEFTGSEATRGALLDSLGRTYEGLGQPAAAARLLERAAAVRERALGPSHPDTIRTLASLVFLYADEAGRAADAVKLGEATLKRAEASLGHDHPETIECRDRLATAYQADGQIERAIPIRQAVLKRREATLGPLDRKVLSSRNALADTLAIAGRTTEAIDLYETTLRQREAVYGPDHPQTLNLRNNLAVAYFEASRFADATRLDEGTLKIRQTKLGPDHPATLTVRNNLAQDYEKLGRFAEGLAMNEATLKMREAKLGPDHPHTLFSRNNLGMSYDFAGRYAEAIALHQRALKAREARLGRAHPDTLASRRRLAEAYLHAGQTGKAVDLLSSALESYRSTLGPDHPSTLATLNLLAQADESLGRWAHAESVRRDVLSRRRRTVPAEGPLLAGDLGALGRDLEKQARSSEAEPLTRESLSIRERVVPDDWARFESMSLLGGALAGQGRFAEAEPLIVRGYEEMKARESRMPAAARHLLAEAAERAERLYEAWRKPDRAAAWKTKRGMIDLPADVFAWPSIVTPAAP
jgi:serine/threonine protein kinase